MFLNLTRDVIRSTARFRLRVQTLRFETATWNQSNSSTCDLCDNDDVQDEQHVLFHCANPHVISLRRKHASLFPPTGGHDVFTFLSQNNNKLYSFLHELNAFYEQVTLTLTYDSSVTTRAHVLHLGFLKKLLGVKKGTDTHCVLRETGQMPIFFYWFRCTIRFWNSLLYLNNPLLEKIVRADLFLANRSDTWTYQVLHALQDLPTSQQFLMPYDLVRLSI
jgi:hypothetical protein